jgi:hypothetical protein
VSRRRLPREAAVARLQVAVGEGRIGLDELAQRADAAYAAVTTAELGILLADLPAATVPSAEIVGVCAREELRSVFGDIRVAAGAAAPRRAGTVFGDVWIDLHLSTVFGDVDVIVSEGVDAELHSWTLFGDRTTELAPAPRLAGAPPPFPPPPF